MFQFERLSSIVSIMALNRVFESFVPDKLFSLFLFFMSFHLRLFPETVVAQGLFRNSEKQIYKERHSRPLLLFDIERDQLTSRFVIPTDNALKLF